MVKTKITALTLFSLIALCWCMGLLGGEDRVTILDVCAYPESSDTDYVATTNLTPSENINVAGWTPYVSSGTVIIEGVPPYRWVHGCGPTVAGMIIGYWDSQGYDDLVDGDAAQQTQDVNNTIASREHYADYIIPIDNEIAYPHPLPDKSELPKGDEHKDNSIADFLKTSQSINGLYYGWSKFDDLYRGLRDYVKWKNPQYDIRAYNLLWGDLTWENFCEEINSYRPVCLLVDPYGSGTPSHLVAAIGYDDEYHYACYHTWDKRIHWYNFTQVEPGKRWGVAGATFCILPQNKQPGIVYVDDDHTPSTPGWEVDHFAGIQRGIDAVADEGTVYVRTGIYNETVVVNKTLSLIGEDREATIIYAPNAEHIVTITSDYTEIENFTVHGNHSHNYAGITVDSCNYTRIRNCTICDNYYGIWLHSSCQTDIISCNVSSNYEGIWVYYFSQYNSVQGCYISSNAHNGVYLCCASAYNTLSQNTFIRNRGAGVEADFSYNKIYLNNFVNNTDNARSPVHDNTWDLGYPSGGNYWDDFDESDEGAHDDDGDGIVDSPYAILGETEDQDLYPLMRPWTGEGDMDADGDVDIFDLARFAQAWGSYGGDPTYHALCDFDDDLDIDIFDLAGFANVWGKTYS